MNSEERRAARRRRRDEKRARNRAARLKDCTVDQAAQITTIASYAKKASSGVKWKASVQRYMANLLVNASKSKEDLLLGRDFHEHFIKFSVYERGKLRNVSASPVAERVMQKVINQVILVPAITPTLTEGCAANVKGRGTDYAVKRLKRQLMAYYAEHGDDGYVLLVDFSDYFASIDHGTCKAVIDKAIDDPVAKKLVFAQIDAYGKMGLGLGSEINQTLAVAIPSAIDHAMLANRSVFASGRYMDDSYCIAHDKDVLWAMLDEIEAICSGLRITVNRRKTKIVRLSRGFTFLKKRFTFDGNGKVVIRPCRSSISRQRRKMRKHARLVSEGIMTFEQANQSYQSCRGSMKRLNSWETVTRLDKLFHELFASDAGVVECQGNLERGGQHDDVPEHGSTPAVLRRHALPAAAAVAATTTAATGIRSEPDRRSPLGVQPGGGRRDVPPVRQEGPVHELRS